MEKGDGVPVQTSEEGEGMGVGVGGRGRGDGGRGVRGVSASHFLPPPPSAYFLCAFKQLV